MKGKKVNNIEYSNNIRIWHIINSKFKKLSDENSRLSSFPLKMA